MDIKHLHHRIIASFSSVRKLFKVKAIYREPSAGPSARVHLESTTTEAFKILKGVRQGDPTKLFTAAMEDVFRNLDWQSNGIMIYGEYLTHLRFADDILLVSHDPLELQTMIRELNEESIKAGLKMNIKKTKVMMCNRLQNNTITVDGKTIEKVDHYTYLGKNISLENETSGEVKRRIQLSWAKFGKLGFIFRNKDLPLHSRNKFSTSA